jgi:uncharacterized membrane protein
MKAEPVEESVEAIVAARDHDGTATPRLQRLIDRTSDLVGRPGFVLLLIVTIAAWVAYNVVAAKARLPVFDPPPFTWLELTMTLAALLLAAFIVATQRREDRLADRRAQLTLQLAVAGERKSAKIIALLEEMRRDSPTLSDRIDSESDAMSAPVNTDAILDWIDSASQSSKYD